MGHLYAGGAPVSSLLLQFINTQIRAKFLGGFRIQIELNFLISVGISRHRGADVTAETFRDVPVIGRF